MRSRTFAAGLTPTLSSASGVSSAAGGAIDLDEVTRPEILDPCRVEGEQPPTQMQTPGTQSRDRSICSCAFPLRPRQSQQRPSFGQGLICHSNDQW